MRLSPEQVDAIKRSTAEVHGPAACVWPFGARVDDSKRGGDIDLYLELPPLSAAQQVAGETQLRVTLQRRLGERKIDIVSRRPDSPARSIEEQARGTGILLSLRRKSSNCACSRPCASALCSSSGWTMRLHRSWARQPQRNASENRYAAQWLTSPGWCAHTCIRRASATRGLINPHITDISMPTKRWLADCGSLLGGGGPEARTRRRLKHLKKAPPDGVRRRPVALAALLGTPQAETCADNNRRVAHGSSGLNNRLIKLVPYPAVRFAPA